MKKITSFLLFVAIIIMIFALSGCAGTSKPTSNDVIMSYNQAGVQKACYENQPQEDNYAGMTVDQMLAAKAIDGLRDANKILGGRSLDPCSEAGGKNFNELQIVKAQESTKKTEKYLNFGTKLIIGGVVAGTVYEGADVWKTYLNRGSSSATASTTSVPLAADAEVIPTADGPLIIEPNGNPAYPPPAE